MLGYLWKHGPCTAYAIRKALAESPSSHWSASAGAIYPLLARFRKLRLVTSRKTAQGDRSAWMIALTSMGRDLFMTWLIPPLDRDVVSLAADPLRTRMFFLGALTPARREKFLASAIEELTRHIDELTPRPYHDNFDRMAIRGAVLLARARIAWLKEVRGKLGTPRRVAR